MMLHENFQSRAGFPEQLSSDLGSSPFCPKLSVPYVRSYGWPIISLTSFSCSQEGKDSDQDFPASPASCTEDLYPSGLSEAVKGFLGEKCLQTDFHKYSDAIDNAFPKARRILFRLTDDPEIENVQSIEALIEIEPDVEKAADAYDRFIENFSMAVSHDNHHYFALSLNFADQG